LIGATNNVLLQVLKERGKIELNSKFYPFDVSKKSADFTK